MTIRDNAASERTTGWRSMFSLPSVYRLAQRVIGAERFRIVLAGEIIRASDSDRVLDLGCGTADILDHLPAVDYLGVEPSQRYVDAAAARFGDRGSFVTSAGERFTAGGGDRTIAMAIGVLHHMDDAAATEMLSVASDALCAGGRFVSIDPTLVDGQSPIAKFLVSRDRGQHVRSPEVQAELVSAAFPDAQISVRHDLLRTPYSHVIVEAAKTS